MLVSCSGHCVHTLRACVHTPTCACAHPGSLCSNDSTQYSPQLCRNIVLQVHGYSSFELVCSKSTYAIVHTVVHTNVF